jgi:uncharacterized protein with PIN domain
MTAPCAPKSASALERDACARAHRAPRLYKGHDFIHTDLA